MHLQWQWKTEVPTETRPTLKMGEALGIIQKQYYWDQKNNRLVLVSKLCELRERERKTWDKMLRRPYLWQKLFWKFNSDISEKLQKLLSERRGVLRRCDLQSTLEILSSSNKLKLNTQSIGMEYDTYTYTESLADRRSSRKVRLV